MVTELTAGATASTSMLAVDGSPVKSGEALLVTASLIVAVPLLRSMVDPVTMPVKSCSLGAIVSWNVNVLVPRRKGNWAVHGPARIERDWDTWSAGNGNGLTERGGEVEILPGDIGGIPRDRHGCHRGWRMLHRIGLITRMRGGQGGAEIVSDGVARIVQIEP